MPAFASPDHRFAVLDQRSALPDHRRIATAQRKSGAGGQAGETRRRSWGAMPARVASDRRQELHGRRSPLRGRGFALDGSRPRLGDLESALHEHRTAVPAGDPRCAAAVPRCTAVEPHPELEIRVPPRDARAAQAANRAPGPRSALSRVSPRRTAVEPRSRAEVRVPPRQAAPRRRRTALLACEPRCAESGPR